MKRKWELDEATAVEARLGAFGKTVVAVNGSELPSSRSLRGKHDIGFALPDGRQAEISVRPQFVGRPVVNLKLAGRMMVATEKKPLKCSACGAAAKPYDRFCGACGQPMPTGEEHFHRHQVGAATNAIKLLAGMFLVFGTIMFFIARAQAAPVLAKLEAMDPNSAFPSPVNGVTYTVAALHDQVAWEPWSVLIVNFILAAAMIGLALWGRRAPLPAVLIATAIYAVVLVGNAIMDPATIGQGLIVKIVVIAILAKGIKSALALRVANA